MIRRRRVIRSWRGRVIETLAVGGVRSGLVADRHSGKSLELVLNTVPVSRVLCRNLRLRRAVVIGQNILFDAGRNGLLWIGREAFEKSEVGDVGKRISTGHDSLTGVEVAIDEGMT